MHRDPGSIFNPASPEAQAISHLFVITLWICAAIFAIVAGIVCYSLVKYRWREGDVEPAQVAGNKRVEIIWTVVPFLIVLLLFGLTLQAMAHSDPPEKPGDPDLVVVGHQWWWEIRSPKWGFTTANEIHIPVGQPISVRLDATDVLHEFWVPQLTRKMTTVPHAGNHVWMQADHAGVYEGVCSEFCGSQHAWMRFEVIADPPAQFEAWVKQQQRAAQPVTGEAQLGRKIFHEMTCVNCHAIRGEADESNAGPDLTHVASRRYLGAGIVPNTPENLRRWLVNPHEVKPGVLMPNFKLNDEQLNDLLAYFKTLQ
jgi:cytochrome c oxidase subunit II